VSGSDAAPGTLTLELLADQLAALARWLTTHVAGFAGPVSAERFADGQSNPTYLLRTPGQRYVLRRRPPGVLLPSAHAVDREFRVLGALSRTSVPVAQPLALCTDDSIIGTTFYVMVHIEGRIFWDPKLSEVPKAERRQYYAAMNEAIARLHCVDYRALGLGDFGKPDNYVARQVARWGRQYAEDSAAGRVPDLDRLIAWLTENAPASAAGAIVHGDFRCDNLIFHPVEPRVLAILDWELATIGDPLADFAYHLMIYRLPDLAFPGLQGVDLEAAGLPGEAEYLAAYCRNTGREQIPDIDYYIVFCIFRLAAILHGIRGRVARGTAVGAKARDYAQQVEPLAAIGWQLATRATRGGGGWVVGV
jgi:aminoglycoside phosphotransferase (APT) family kinase protein